MTVDESVMVQCEDPGIIHSVVNLITNHVSRYVNGELLTSRENLREI